jgi:serine/threonine protein kinase
VDRYVITDIVAAGGMGILYSAQDPRLDRKIALKVLRDDLPLGDDSQARLLREGQAMAQLSHPNVVSVHDAGHFGHQVYVAMEFVEGRTLTRWLDERERTWPEVLGAFVEAGKGVAAAHAVGIIHRDFKPDNVLVGHDGQVKVTDFGLARSVDGVEMLQAAQDIEGGPGNQTAWDLLLTQTKTGVLRGTPAYMAHEQFLEGKADERTDQFSFCVALYRGLYRQWPFPAKKEAGLGGLVKRLASGDVAPPPEGSKVPNAVKAAILRGLRKAPADRHFSMEALLSILAGAVSADAVAQTEAKLEPTRTRWPRWAAGAAAAALSVVIVVVVLLAIRSRQTPAVVQAEAAAPAPIVAPPLDTSVSRRVDPVNDPVVVVQTRAAPLPAIKSPVRRRKHPAAPQMPPRATKAYDDKLLAPDLSVHP